jgi:hypothetical protein
MKSFIRELADKNLTRDGYKGLLKFVHAVVKKYRWPKIMIGECGDPNTPWREEEIIVLAHRFAVYLYDEKKLDYIAKVPEIYVKHYFTQILVGFAAKTIASIQNDTGLSYESIKRISLPILKDSYFSRRIEGATYWWVKTSFDVDAVNPRQIEEKIRYLSRIPLSENTKHYKPLVHDAIYTVFSLIDSPIEESVLLKTLFSMFDQTSISMTQNDASAMFKHPDDSVASDDAEIHQKIAIIFQKTDPGDFPLIHDYLFNEKKITIEQLSKKYSIPKSTVHHRITRFKKTLRTYFTPKNDENGLTFLKSLKKKLENDGKFLFIDL